MGEAEHYFRAAELLRMCKPSSFLEVSEDRLQGDLDCLAALGERDLIVAIADCFLDAAPRSPHPRRLLLLSAACLAVGAEERAITLLSSEAPQSRGANSIGAFAGIYPVRLLFPQHWSRRDEQGLVTFSAPRILGRPSGHSVTLPLPFQDCAVIEGARVFGEFNIIDGQDRLAIYDLAGHPRLPNVAGQALEVKGTALAMDRAVVYRGYDRRERLSCAVHIAGRCASNYFHWMIEYLPRILTAIEAGADARAKLLVPAKMTPSMRRALDIVNAGRFPIHEFASSDLLEVDRLFVPSMHTCVVDGRALPLSRIGALSPRHLRFVRERILRRVQEYDRGPDLPRKVLLVRGRRMRSLDTEEEIRSALIEIGFVAIDPMQLQFEDQVRLFRDAEVVVTASGAALTNLLFCQNNPDIIALIGAHIADFNLYSNLLQIAGGGRFSQVPGRVLASPTRVVSEEHYIHADYTVEVEAVMQTLRNLKEES